MNQVILIALLLAAAGCSPVSFEDPEISLADIRLTRVRLFETELTAMVRIKNYDNRPMSIGRAVYRLYLNDVDLGRGAAVESITVPALGSELQEVLFQLGNMDIAANIRPILEARSIRYKAEAKLYTGRFLSRAKPVVVRRDGRLDLGVPPARAP